MKMYQKISTNFFIVCVFSKHKYHKKALEDNIITTSTGGLVYAGDLKYGVLSQSMQHLACFSGGMFALGSEGSSDPEHYMKLGADITKTCHESYVRSR